MGFFGWLFGKNKKRAEVSEDEFAYDEWDEIGIRKEDYDLEDPIQREKYVRCLLEQIGEAEQTIQSLTAEYASVTSYLKDMEEIEALPAAERDELLACAKQIRLIEEKREQNPTRKSKLAEEEYRRLQSMEAELSEGLDKIRKAEDYQGLIKKDLKRLDAEHQAYEIRRKELNVTLANTKSISVICVSAMAICMLTLLFFQFGLQMDAGIGYILTGLLTAGVLTFVFVRFRDASQELRRVNQAIQKLISLQNRVKIRYVNNTNLLEYLYTKYLASSGEELEKKLQLFYEEREERQQYERMLEDLSYYQKELMRIMRRYQLYDPTVWLHRTEALLNAREMVEIRHTYIGQRQKLRKQMENNQKLADEWQKDIRELVERYPDSAKRILDIVDEYE